MNLILNIGTTSEGRPNLKETEMVLELYHAGFIVEDHKIIQSDTEPTLVARVLAPSYHTDERIHSLSVLWNQECIAVYDRIAGTGRLVGPKAEAWGDFNPEYFFLIDGTRLANNFAKAA